MKKIVKYSFALLSGLLLLASCTDTESIKINEPEQHPNYGQYLAKLRDYRKTDHKVVIGWFDNIETAVSRAHHLKDVADSVDVVSLLNPDNLPQWLINEMGVVRNDKGMKVIYNISYKAITNEYNKLVENTPEGEQPIDFVEFIEQSIEYQVSLCDKYGYDGISVSYYGISTAHMEDDEKAQYLAEQDAFMVPVKEWAEGNTAKMFIFEGTPEHIEDKTILQLCDYIVLNATEIRSVDGLTFRQRQAMSYAGVPADRLIMMVEPTATNPADITTGSFTDPHGNSSRAIPEAAKWVDSYDSGLTKPGLGIYHIQNDYYIQSLEYRYTREAISIMNSYTQNR